MDIETRKTHMKNNISTAKRVTNKTTSKDFAAELGIKTTTWHTFENNLSSNSSAKTAFCNHFGITVKQFEEEDLSENCFVKKNSSIDSIDDVIPIVELSDDIIFKAIMNNPSSNNEKLNTVKDRVIENNDVLFNIALSNARKCKQPLDIITNFNAAWQVLSKSNIALITKSDLNIFIHSCEQLNQKQSIEFLTDKLLSQELFNKKIVLLYSALLEKNFPEMAILCYESTLEE